MGKKITDEYKNLEDTSLFGAKADDFDKWDSAQLADFLSSAGLMAYKKMVLDHKITGKHAHLLTDEDLRDMGMIVVGDRLRFKQLMMTMGRKARFSSTTKVMWSGEEQKYYSDTEQMCCTCMGLVPDGKFTSMQAIPDACLSIWQAIFSSPLFLFRIMQTQPLTN